MKKTENSRILIFLSLIFALSIAIFISNIVRYNLFAIIINIAVMMLICLAFGYVYGKREILSVNKACKCEKTETHENTEELHVTQPKLISKDFDDI